MYNPVAEKSLENFNILLAEAYDNYDTGRFEDAGKSFEHLASLCVKMENYADMYYFIYRALIAWKISNRMDRIYKVYQRIGIFSVKLSSKIIEAYIPEIFDLFEKEEMFNALKSNYIMLGDKKNVETINTQLMEIYEDIINNYELEFRKMTTYQQKYIDLCHEIGNVKQEVKQKQKMAKYIEKYAKFTLENGEFDPEYVAIKLYKEALNIYKNLKDEKNIKKINNIIEKIEKIISSER